MPPLICQVRGATVLTIYMTDKPSKLSLANTNLHIHFICTQDKIHSLKRSEIFFYPERDKALPE